MASLYFSSNHLFVLSGRPPLASNSWHLDTAAQSR